MSSSVPNRNIVDIGKYLQKYGLSIGEHPAFGGVGKGHSSIGYHPIGAAIDVRDWRPDIAPAYEGGAPKHWKQRTGELSWRAKQLGLFNEALGPGDKGHDTHVHLALEGNKPITEQQLEWLATGRYKTPEGKLTDVMPSAQTPSYQSSIPETTKNPVEIVNIYMHQKSRQAANPYTDFLNQFVTEQLLQAPPTSSLMSPQQLFGMLSSAAT